MASQRICKIDGCGKPYLASGFCRAHYKKWKRHGDPHGGYNFRGHPQAWLSRQAKIVDDHCMIWPFGKAAFGYGVVWRETKMIAAHIVMCEAVHGPRPSDVHEVAHSCGKGRDGCVNPKHLRWATKTSNEADKIIHGTSNRGERNGHSKLTQADIKTIRSLAGKMKQSDIADEYGVTRGGISSIVTGRTWGWVP